jgi:hypothetical protein
LLSVLAVVERSNLAEAADGFLNGGFVMESPLQIPAHFRNGVPSPRKQLHSNGEGIRFFLILQNARSA